MAAELPAASLRLADRVDGLAERIRFFPDGTKTAQDAAEAIGCPVSAIVKSLVFVVEAEGSKEPVVALVPGDLRLDTDKLAAAAGAERARRATLDEVREATGYAAGGTPPFGHARDLRVFADHGAHHRGERARRCQYKQRLGHTRYLRGVVSPITMSLWRRRATSSSSPELSAR